MSLSAAKRKKLSLTRHLCTVSLAQHWPWLTGTCAWKMHPRGNSSQHEQSQQNDKHPHCTRKLPNPRSSQDSKCIWKEVYQKNMCVCTSMYKCVCTLSWSTLCLEHHLSFCKKTGVKIFFCSLMTETTKIIRFPTCNHNRRFWCLAVI